MVFTKQTARCEGRKGDRAKARRKLSEDLLSDLETLWQEQGYWQNDERWASDTARGDAILGLPAAPEEDRGTEDDV